MDVRWEKLCCELHVLAPLVDVWWRRLAAAYGEAHRRYHTMRHLEELMELLDAHGIAAGVKDRVAIELAVFFHDVVYDCFAGISPGANERQSAALFERFADDVEMRADLRAKVRTWILMTIDHRVDVDADVDARFFMDIDMSILGKPWVRYEEYSAQVRAEYAYLWPPLLWIGRRRFLRSAAAAPAGTGAVHPVFATALFRDSLGYERRARSNAAREADALETRIAALCAASLVPVLGAAHLALRPKGRAGAALALALTAARAVARAALRPATALLLAALLLLVPCVVGFAWWTSVSLAIDANGAVVDARAAVASARGESSRGSGGSAPRCADTAVFAGSFNPPHRGHLAVVSYLARAHAHVVVVVGVNASKPMREGAWELERRRELLDEMLRACGVANARAVVVGACGARQHQWAWIHEYARSVGARRLYRGIRTLRKDLPSELALALSNLVGPLLPCVGARGRGCASRRPLPTRYVLAPPSLCALSSTKLRAALDAARGGGNDAAQRLEEFLPRAAVSAAVASWAHVGDGAKAE